MSAQSSIRSADRRRGKEDFSFTDADFRQIAGILREDAGIALNEAKAPLVYARLVKRLRALGLESFRAYCLLIGSPDGVEERRRMTSALTTNVTRFFREPHHFEHLAKEVLPGLIDRARRGGRVRLWSAGCSTGQEPYSIALTVLKALPNAHCLDFKILATDIDPEVLRQGKAGSYPEAAVDQIAPADLERWFESSPGGWQTSEPLRRLIAFKQLNLIGQWPMRGPFDVVFCRNTVIYFDDELQAQVWGKISGMVAPGGSLYIGHSERVTGAPAFEPVGMTIYRKKAEV